MLRRAGQSIQLPLRRLYHQSHSAPHTRRSLATLAGAASGLTIGSYLWYTNSPRIYNDTEAATGIDLSTPSIPQSKFLSPEASLWRDQQIIHTLIWGSNNSQVLEASGVAISEGENQETSLRIPTIAKWLENVALREMQLHRHYAACVDGRGDVYQWGDGMMGSAASEGAAKPILILKGKNIIKIQLTERKLYALSASGKVYVLAADALGQQSPPSSNSWTGWLFGDGKTNQYQELASRQPLNWTEKFISIAAGENHLLALTNKGRTFAHPVNKEANRFGQLGFQSFEIPDPTAAALKKKPANRSVELPPKPSRSSLGIAARNSAESDLVSVDDSTIHWCPHLFEIPVLRGVEASQIAAGGRSSFVRTPTGRVLGWGANEYGQIGLGANNTLDIITIPTEVVLWRMTPKNTRSSCLDVTAGGDLTSFVVERSTSSSPKTTDLLMCGNGQNGGLGNNTYTNSQGNPIRVKNVSGLVQYSERTKQLEQMKPTDIVISPTGHVLVALDSAAESEVGGRDLMVWGKNFDYELGNGKKSSTAMPIALNAPDGQRLMLMRKKAEKVIDLSGRVWKRNVAVEQKPVAGYGNTAVYWKIVG